MCDIRVHKYRQGQSLILLKLLFKYMEKNYFAYHYAPVNNYK